MKTRTHTGHRHHTYPKRKRMRLGTLAIPLPATPVPGRLVGRSRHSRLSTVGICTFVLSSLSATHCPPTLPHLHCWRLHVPALLSAHPAGPCLCHAAPPTPREPKGSKHAWQHGSSTPTAVHITGATGGRDRTRKNPWCRKRRAARRLGSQAEPATEAHAAEHRSQ